MLILICPLTVLAVQLGNMEAATQLLDVIDSNEDVSLVPNDDVDNDDGDGRTIFHHAVILGKPDKIWELINTLKKKYSIDVLQNILDREVTTHSASSWLTNVRALR